MATPVIDMLGIKFGRLLVTSRFGKTKKGAITWMCKCDCGATKEIDGNSLRSGATKSCGCWKLEVAAAKGHRNKTHGHARSTRIGVTPTYSSWRSMRARCDEINHISYKWYGGKGIAYCPEWNDFSVFLKDMGERPIGTTLDRKDNSLGYSKGNCKWSTEKDQQNNRTSNRLITALGETLTLAQWASRSGIHPTTISKRLSTGMGADEAVSKPSRNRKNKNGRLVK